jgi:hypothetical protein
MDDERRYPRLTPEQKKETLESLAEYIAGGYLQRRFAPHFLNLEQEQFSLREIEYKNLISPPEFFFCAMPVLDAYATAFLSAHLDPKAFAALRFTCALKLQAGALKLLIFVTPEQGEILSGQRLGIHMLQCFPKALAAKEINSGTVFLLEGAGVPMQIDYPGQMKVGAVPILKARSQEMWPEAYLHVPCTGETITRARSAMDFIRDESVADLPPV